MIKIYTGSRIIICRNGIGEARTRVFEGCESFPFSICKGVSSKGVSKVGFLFFLFSQTWHLSILVTFNYGFHPALKPIPRRTASNIFPVILARVSINDKRRNQCLRFLTPPPPSPHTVLLCAPSVSPSPVFSSMNLL